MPVDQPPVKIALCLLLVNGDCLYGTIVARQIKTDYPNSTLTWYIAEQCKSMIEHNPDIDQIVTVDVKNKDAISIWHETDQMLVEKNNNGEFDLYFSIQNFGDNLANYTGSIRGNILKCYPNPITITNKPYIYLTSVEIEKVKRFAENNKLSAFKNIVLFECAPTSGQLQLNTKIATQMCEQLLGESSDTCFILTSGQKVISAHKNIFDASVLTIRENAELVNYCTHFIGCSSGISWLITSSWCKPLPILQLLDDTSFFFNSMCRDFKYNHLDSTLITEIRFDQIQTVQTTIGDFIKDHKSAKENYHVEFQDRSRTIYTLCRRFLIQFKLQFPFRIIKNTFELNKTNSYYYFTVAKLILLFPLYMLLGLLRKR